jgi:uncharacterized membrane protein YbhN (UPF0104 family)
MLSPESRESDLGHAGSNRRRLRLLAVGVLTGVVLAMVFCSVDIQVVLKTLYRADMGLFGVAAVVALFFNTVQSAEGFRQALRAFGARVPFASAFAATVSSLAIHAALPAGAGGAGRIAYLYRSAGIDVGRCTAAVVSLLWIKLCWLLGLALLGWGLTADASALRGGLLGLALLACVASYALGLRYAERIAARFPAAGRLAPVSRVLLPATTAMRQVRLGALAVTAMHALVAVSAELLIFGMVVYALGAIPDPVAIVAWLPLVIIAAKIPVTLMGLGTREGLVVVLLRAMARPEILLGAALLFSFVEHLLSALLGSLFTWHFFRRILDGRSE